MTDILGHMTPVLDLTFSRNIFTLTQCVASRQKLDTASTSICEGGREGGRERGWEGGRERMISLLRSKVYVEARERKIVFSSTFLLRVFVSIL